MKIDIVAKVIKFGNSLGITIKKDVTEILDVKEGDFLQISIQKIEKKRVL